MVKGVDDSERPRSPERAREILSLIREAERRKLAESDEGALEELQGLRHAMSETLDNPTHVLPELLQNADDIGGTCTEVTIQLTTDRLVVRNHREPMTAANVDALGAYTKSTKRDDLNSIGHFGIGFKTVFSVTDTPYIHSGYFSFRYVAAERTTPEPVPYTEQPATDTECVDGTTIVLPFSEEARKNRREILEEQLKSIGSLIPFLNNIKTVNVSLYGDCQTYHRDAVGEEVFEVVCKRDGEREIRERMRLFSESVDPDERLIKSLADKRHLDAATLKELDPTLDVTIAVPLDEDGAPTTREQSRLFCYFPTEPDTQLPFDIQADFSLKPDRKHIAWPDEFNRALLDRVPAVFETAFVTFHQEQADPSRILELVPDVTQDREQTPYLDSVVEEIISFVRSESCVPDRDGNLFRPSEVIFLDQPFRELFSETELGALLDRPVQYPSEQLSAAARSRLRAIVPDSYIDVDTLLEHCAGASLFESKSDAWLIRFMAGAMRYWNAEYESDARHPSYEERQAQNAFLERLGAVPFLPLESGSVTSVAELDGEIYRIGIRYADDYQLFTDVEVLHLLSGDLLSTLDQPEEDIERDAAHAEDLLFDDQLLGIPKLEARDVVQEVINPAFENGSLDPARADKFILFLARRPGTVADIAEIKLQTADGTPTADDVRAPETLYLGTDYIHDYNTETLFGVFEELVPVSNHYLELGELSREEWIDALAQLGVRQRIEVLEQDPWESDRFRSETKVRAFLEKHGDRGETHVHDERHLNGFNGKTDWPWMKRKNRHGSVKNYKYALIDRFLPEVSRTKLEALSGDGEGSGDVAYWAEFLRMLDADWDEYYRDTVYRDYKYSERDGKYRVKDGDCYCPSSFGRFLRDCTWTPGSDGSLHKPQDLFVSNEQTEDKPVVFVDPEPTTYELIEFLELQTTPGVQVTVSTLQQRIDRFQDAMRDPNSDPDPDELESTIRKQLAPIELDLLDGDSGITDQDAAERLRKMRFIFVSSADRAFRTPDEVTWSGPALGEYLVPISGIYGDFESLFTALGVRPEPTWEDCVGFLGTEESQTAGGSNGNGSLWSHFETAWGRVLQQTVYLPRTQLEGPDDSLADARSLLQSDGCVPTAAETLANWDDVRFHSTNQALLTTLPRSLQSQVLASERDRRYEDAIYTERLARLTGTRPLENALELEFSTTVHEDDRIGTLVDEHRPLLDVAYSYLLSSDESLTTKAETVVGLARLDLYHVEVLECQYYLDGQHQTTTRDIQCFIDTDTDQGRIVLSSGDRSEFALVDALVRELQLNPTGQSQLTSLLKGALGKPDSLLRAFLTDSNYEYHELPETSPSESAPNEETSQDDSASVDDQAPTEDPEPESELGREGAESAEGVASARGRDSVPTSNEDTNASVQPGDGAGASSEHSVSPGDIASGSNSEQTASNGSGSDTNSKTTEDETSSDRRPPVPPSQRADVSAGDQSAIGRDSDEGPSDPRTGSEATDSPQGDDQKQPQPSGGGRGGGWGRDGGGREPKKSGDKGEAFVFNELLTLVEQHFRKTGGLTESTMEEPKQKALIRGTYDGSDTESDRTVRIQDVSHQNLGYDIYVKGATLAQTQTELGIDELVAGANTFVEVKASKGQSRVFTLSKHEYETAVAWPSEYVIIRIHDVRENPVVDRVFHTVPDLDTVIDDIQHRPDGVEIEYER